MNESEVMESVTSPNFFTFPLQVFLPLRSSGVITFV